MRYSKFFGKTVWTDPKDEVSTNAKLLIRGGFVRKEVAGVYNYLPLGLRVLNKIANIVREEMNGAGGQEILLSALQNKENWQKTDRWEAFDALFKVKSRFEHEYGLGPTHEEVLVPLVKQLVSSYKDLPLALYQIQTKFRDEERAKSGVLRGREFLMKDLYSFHADEEDFNQYYEAMKQAYKTVFDRCGVSAILTEASGGAFSKFSHEFQVITEAGEDEIIYCEKHHFAVNIEIAKQKEGDGCPVCSLKLQRGKAIEVGNIFPLKTRFSEAFDLTYKNEKGEDLSVIMGCYGIGISRLMGAIVEVHHDKKGMVWPKSVAPYLVHLVGIMNQELGIRERADVVYQSLQEEGVEVLYDDREDVSVGEKFADADIIGIPVRLVISARVGEAKVEWKERSSSEHEIIPIKEAIDRLT